MIESRARLFWGWMGSETFFYCRFVLSEIYCFLNMQDIFSFSIDHKHSLKHNIYFKVKTSFPYNCEASYYL